MGREGFDYRHFQTHRRSSVSPHSTVRVVKGKPHDGVEQQIVRPG